MEERANMFTLANQESSIDNLSATEKILYSLLVPVCLYVVFIRSWLLRYRSFWQLWCIFEKSLAAWVFKHSVGKGPGRYCHS